MAKLVVDKDKCMACGYCYATDEEHFQPDENGYSEVISQDETDAPMVQEVIDACPTGAISLENE